MKKTILIAILTTAMMSSASAGFPFSDMFTDMTDAISDVTSSMTDSMTDVTDNMRDTVDDIKDDDNKKECDDK